MSCNIQFTNHCLFNELFHGACTCQCMIHVIKCHFSKTTFLTIGTLLVLICPARATSITRRTLRSTDGYDLKTPTMISITWHYNAWRTLYCINDANSVKWHDMGGFIVLYDKLINVWYGLICNCKGMIWRSIHVCTWVVCFDTKPIKTLYLW